MKYSDARSMDASKILWWIFKVLIIISVIIGIFTIIFKRDVASYEYFIRRDTIHTRFCPKSTLWLEKKRNKYQFEKLREWTFCDACFKEDEVNMMMAISNYNIDRMAERIDSVYKEDTSQWKAHIVHLEARYDWVYHGGR